MQQPLEVYANPYDELPLKTDKYAASCTDIHLGKRNITKLQGFEKFLSLDTLWLNDNKLKSFEGLEDNFRLKGLHLFGNRLKQLRRYCFQPFKFLGTLTLNDNQLDDIDSTLRELKCLKNLKTLNLYNNPIAEEDNYRLRVLSVMPSVTTFDRHAVTDEEREQVHIFKEKMKKLKNLDLGGGGKKTLNPLKDEEAERYKAKALKDILDILRTHALDHRSFLEISFLEEDKRHLGIVSEEKFWSVMHEYGFSQLMSDREKEIIVERYYKKRAQVPSISMTGTLPRPSYNYLKFCRDMLPDRLLVVPDHESWKKDWAPEVSATTRALNTYVHNVTTQREIEETLFKKRTMLAAGAREEKLVNIFGGRKSNVVDCGLNPWQQIELSKVMEAETGPLPPESMARQQCESILKNMSKYKKCPELGIHATLNNIFKNYADAGGKINTAVFRALIGCPPRSTLNTSAAVATFSGNGGSKSGKGSSASQPGRSGSVMGGAAPPGREVAPCMMWRDLGVDELENMESKAFEESGQLLDALLRSKTDSDNYSTLFSQTIQSGILGTRLAAGKTRRPEVRDFIPPAEVMAGAGRRSDVAVLPNLRASVTLNKNQPPMTSPAKKATSASPVKEKMMTQTMMLMKKGIAPGVGWAPGTTTLVINGK